MTCQWPNGVCKCWEQEQSKPDPFGRVWMQCEEGLSMTAASMSRFMLYCLANCVEIGSVHPFNPRYKRSLVLATVRIRPEQVADFERETGGKLRHPPKIRLNAALAERPEDQEVRE